VSVITVRTTRVEINRKAFDAIQLGAADGLFEIANRIVDGANPPDSPRLPYPIGKGLPQQGGAAAWIGKKKVNNASMDGSTVAKPRSLVLVEGQATAIAGFGFPARFVELGTIDTPAEPFLTPSAMREVPDGEAVLSAAMQRRLRGERLKPGQRDAR
jgi:hypothetical protein